MFAGVVDTADKHSFANISANFRKKFEMVLMGYSGAKGTLIYEKNQMSKISCQTPFNCYFRQAVPLNPQLAPVTVNLTVYKNEITAILLAKLTNLI